MVKVACLILAAGRGRRLRPLTYFLHKSLIPLGKSKRVIDYALDSCRNLAPKDREVFVLARYKAKQVQRYLGQLTK